MGYLYKSVDENGRTMFTTARDVEGKPVTDVQLTGSTLQEQLTENDAVSGVLTFVKNVSKVEIYNGDEANSGVFTVNGMDITVPPTRLFHAEIGGTPSNEVAVSGTTSYIVGRYA